MTVMDRLDIPDIWIAGFCLHGATPAEAVAWWMEQERMSKA